MTEAPATSKKSKLLIPAAVALLALLGGIFFISRSGLDQVIVKQKLDEYIVLLKEKGKASGRAIDVTYGEVQVVGTLINKHAVINKPVMTIKPLTPETITPDGDSSAVVVTTDTLEIHGESMDLSALRFSLPHPVNFAGMNAPEKSLLKIESNGPLEATISQKKLQDLTYTALSHTAPASIDLTYLRVEHAEGKEDATPTVVPVYDTIHITIAPNSTIKTNLADDDSGLGTADISFKQITTSPKSAPEGIITVAGIEAHWSNTLDAQKTPVIKNKMNIGPITAPDGVLPYAPMALNVDFGYVGASEDDSDGDVEDANKKSAAKDPTITLKNFELTTKDASLSATADFISSPTDMLPTGKARVTLKNVPFVLAELKKRKMLTPEAEIWVPELLQKVTGTPLAQLTDADVAIEREHGGAFKIGNTTFEEVFATILKHALKINPPAETGDDVEEVAPEGAAVPAPTLPDASKEKTKPIAVPDNGVRG
jgi:hypothetical protein